jgi:hypothetical protein
MGQVFAGWRSTVMTISRQKREREAVDRGLTA